jgi:hypothetical protein
MTGIVKQFVRWIINFRASPVTATPALLSIRRKTAAHDNPAEPLSLPYLIFDRFPRQ